MRQSLKQRALKQNYLITKNDAMSSNICYQKKERIYYEHTDAGGVVYHANYLNFCERCRCDWLEEIGWGVATTLERNDIMWVVREANLRYDVPARLFDEITVDCTVLHVGKVSLKVEQNIYNGDVLLCSATIKLATLDKTSFKLAPMPIDLRSALSKTL